MKYKLLEIMMENFNLPQDHRPFIDKYFLRAKEILEKENLNPTVKAQVFIRNGNCSVCGINEAIAIITKYGRVNKLWTLDEGELFEGGECLMLIEAPIQGIIDLETMYLGVLSTETTLKNGGEDIDLEKIKNNMSEIVKLVGNRPVSYFGARHWRFNRDYEISKACFEAGAKSCSTDVGASSVNQKGIGTIPHALEAIYHWKYGLEDAVYMASKAFDYLIDENVSRIALIDYANREIADSLRCIDMVSGIRVDTCGENLMEGVMPIDPIVPGLKYWFGNGVTISGVYALRKILNNKGFYDKKIMLSSGFGNPEKVKEFIKAEHLLSIKLFDALGVGGVFESRMATMDIIEVDGEQIHKIGRMPKDISRLKRRI
jgi:nicotinate phosphoribosyltransferase